MGDGSIASNESNTTLKACWKEGISSFKFHMCKLCKSLPTMESDLSWMSTHLSETSTDPILPVEASVIRTNMVIKKSLSMLSHSTGHQPSLAEDIGAPITDFLGWKQLKKSSIKWICDQQKRESHLSKRRGDCKQNDTHEKQSFSSPDFHVVSCGKIRFVAIGSSKHLLLTSCNS